MSTIVAFLGSLIGSFIGAKLGLIKDLVSIKRSRLEDYVKSINSCDDYTTALSNHYLFDENGQISEQPLSTLNTLTVLYFDKVKTEFDNFQKSLNDYKLFLMDNKIKRLNNPALTGDLRQEAIHESKDLFRKIYNCRDSLIESLIFTYPLLKDPYDYPKGIKKNIHFFKTILD